ncbi:Uncharacterised protein [Vibrio cholerae]|nr:Uncharacterised protein [Vibrio cholerae]CSD08940.1 Uncharacterised protein [Vibrio cholerae]
MSVRGSFLNSSVKPRIGSAGAATTFSNIKHIHVKLGWEGMIELIKIYRIYTSLVFR